ncbi:MAG: histidinol-phosphate transaminase [Acidimicrobiia bacterium]
MRLNPAVERISPYVGGRPIEEVVREFGVVDVVKLASNESPIEPFPEVVAAVAEAAAGINRYPDQAVFDLGRRLGDHLGVEPDHLWFGAGSSELLGAIALSLGGPGTTAVFAWPSFAMYPIGTMRSGADPRRVPLDEDFRHDLGALAAAVDATTTVVYVCNPNNPTGTLVAGHEVEAFCRAVPEDVVVVVDEAYHEYVTDPRHRTMLPLALERPNVVVLRTFSKVYGLAGLRIGYAVGLPETLAALRRPQRPFTVTQLAQVAAAEALRHPALVAQRVAENAAGRRVLETGLADRGLAVGDSQANFVFTDVGPVADHLNDRLLRKGMIVRPFEGALRVSVGTEIENRRFLLALDQVL